MTYDRSLLRCAHPTYSGRLLLKVTGNQHRLEASHAWSGVAGGHPGIKRTAHRSDPLTGWCTHLRVLGVASSEAYAHPIAVYAAHRTACGPSGHTSCYVPRVSLGRLIPNLVTIFGETFLLLIFLCLLVPFLAFLLHLTLTDRLPFPFREVAFRRDLFLIRCSVSRPLLRKRCSVATALSPNLHKFLHYSEREKERR